ncbi:TniQ family protein [Desmonostoc muscorum CCALA 125]|nr:TniQ family protein [Desmonostoc muscorum CCALA 125]
MKKQIFFIPFDLGNFTIQNLPKISHLYPLQPIGLGTPNTESLSSYLQRLAQQHCLRSWQLYTYELVPLIQHQEYLLHKDTKKTSLKQIFLTNKKTASNLSVINGLQSITPVIVTAIEQLTSRQDLYSLTLMSWLKVFDSAELLLKPSCAWCPYCYQAWREQGQVIYIPLLWLIEYVKFCPQHEISLENTCPSCNQKMLNFCQPGYCSHCGEWLGQTKYPLKLTTYFRSMGCLSTYQRNISYLQELIAITPYLSKQPQIKDVYSYLHERCVHLDEQGLKDLSFSFWMSSHLIAKPQSSDTAYKPRISLHFLSEVFRCFNITPRQLFL